MPNDAGPLRQGPGVVRANDPPVVARRLIVPRPSALGQGGMCEGPEKHARGPVAASILTQVLAALPFADQVEIELIAARLPTAIDFAMCVPAQNEEHFLPATLNAMLAALRRSGGRGAIVLLINNSADRSFTVAHDVLRASDCGFLVASAALHADIADAPHARRLALDIGAWLSPHGVLLTTDADTLVDPDWVSVNLGHVRGGTDLVCGAVSIDPQEYAALPAPVRHCGAVEAAYAKHLEQCWQSWTAGTAPGFQIAAMGASLALTAARYRAVGGMPVPPVAEDKALAALARRHGWSIKLADDVKVETSGRLIARAAGGMGDALRSRATDDDPFCDEQLVPLALLRRLADIWNALPDDFANGLANGIANGIANCGERYARLQDAIARDPALQHRRMRLSQVVAELSSSDERPASENRLSGARA